MFPIKKVSYFKLENIVHKTIILYYIIKFSENGVAVVENFLAENETNELKSEVNKMLKSSDIGKDKPAIFSCDLSTQVRF